MRQGRPPGELAIATLSPADVELDARTLVQPDLFVVPLVNGRRMEAWSEIEGRLLLVDYGGEGAEVHDGRRPPVRTYVGGQPGGDPVLAPGQQDLTADVDFGALRAAARELGLAELAHLDQGAWLERHGATLPPVERRRDEDWRLAGLLDRRLPFRVLLLEKH